METKITFNTNGNANKVKYVLNTSDNQEIEFTEQDLKVLGQLKDIEEKLGIDLITFVKCCLQGRVYSKFWERYVYFTGEEDSILEEGFVCYTSGKNELYRYKDYGKTWVLDKEELEDGK